MTRKRKKHVKTSNDSANGPDLITIGEKAAADGCSDRDLLRKGEQFTVKLFFGVRPSSAFLVDSLGERHPLIGETTHRGFEELLGNYAGEILRFGKVMVSYFPADPSFLASLPPVEGRDGALWRWQLKEPQLVTAEHVWIARDHVVGDTEASGTPSIGQASRSEHADNHGQWWDLEYPLSEMFQNIGEALHHERRRKGVKKVVSNSDIAKEIEKRIRNEERRNGKSRECPSWDTIRGRFTGKSFKPALE